MREQFLLPSQFSSLFVIYTSAFYIDLTWYVEIYPYRNSM